MKNKDKALYFLAILPESPYHEEILAFKQEVAERFNSKAALRSPPHITLHMPFKFSPDKEDQLKEKLAAFAQTRSPVSISLNGFGAFAPRVIFVAVVPNALLTDLHHGLIRHAKTELGLLNGDYKDQGFHPHVTIAFRDLRKSMFREAWPHYEAQSYEATFTAHKLALLKHNGQQWLVFQEFPFRSGITESYSSSS